VDYRKEELKFADNEQRVVAVHEHLVSLVTQARKALKNKESERLKKLLDAAMDTVATLDMHLDSGQIRRLLLRFVAGMYFGRFA